MLILADHDVVGAVRVFQRLLESPEWAPWTAALGLELISLQDVELPRDAADAAVWQRHQEMGGLLIAGNRSSGEGRLCTCLNTGSESGGQNHNVFRFEMLLIFP